METEVKIVICMSLAREGCNTLGMMRSKERGLPQIELRY